MHFGDTESFQVIMHLLSAAHVEYHLPLMGAGERPHVIPRSRERVTAFSDHPAPHLRTTTNTNTAIVTVTHRHAPCMTPALMTHVQYPPD